MAKTSPFQKETLYKADQILNSLVAKDAKKTEQPPVAPTPDTPQATPVQPPDELNFPIDIGKPRTEIDLETARKRVAQAEATVKKLERTIDNAWGILTINRKGKKSAAEAEYEAAKTEYANARRELREGNAWQWIFEEETALKERAKALGESKNKFGKFRQGVAKLWKASGDLNLLEKAGNKWDIAWIKQWKEEAEGSWRGAGVKGFLKKLRGKAAFGLTSIRSIASITLLGGTLGFASTGMEAGFALTSSARIGMSAIGGYFGGSGLARGVNEWAASRKDKKILEQHNDLRGTLPANDTERPIHDTRMEALFRRRGELEATILLGGGINAQTEAAITEFTEISAELAAKYEIAIGDLAQKTKEKGEAAMQDKNRRERIYKLLGGAMGAVMGSVGFGSMLEGEAAILDAKANESVMSARGIRIAESAKAIVPPPPETIGAKTLGWQSADIAKYGGSNLNPEQFARAKNALNALEGAGAGKGPDALKTLGLTLDDLKDGRAGLAEKLTKVLGLKNEPVTLSNLGKVLEKHNLIGDADNLSELKSVLKSAISIEIAGDNNQYGKALESALTDLAHKATDSGDAVAIATLKKFFASVNMSNVDVTDLDQAEIHKAMLKKVGFHGAQGKVNDDVWNVVHRGNRLIITTDGTVDVIQSLGKEAASQVDEIKFAENLAREIGADPKSVSFKNGWGEVGMKLRGQEISIKNPHSGFDTYEEMREHAEKQIVTKAKEAILANPLTKEPWTPFRYPEAYQNLKGISGLREFLYADHQGAGSFSAVEIPHNLLPGISDTTHVIGIDVRPVSAAFKTTDNIPELNIVTVPSGEILPSALGRSTNIAVEKITASGTIKQMLAETTQATLNVEKNLAALTKTLNVTNDQASWYLKAFDQKLNQTPVAFRENVLSHAEKVHTRLGGNLSAVMDGRGWDDKQLQTDGFIPDAFTGTTRTNMLEISRTMDGLNAGQSALAAEALEAKSAKALGTLLNTEIANSPRMIASYNPARNIALFQKVEINGDSCNVTVNFKTKEVWVGKPILGFGGKGTLVGKIGSIKSLHVR